MASWSDDSSIIPDRLATALTTFNSVPFAHIGRLSTYGSDTCCTVGDFDVAWYSAAIFGEIDQVGWVCFPIAARQRVHIRIIELGKLFVHI
jgi:hypothetical protein